MSGLLPRSRRRVLARARRTAALAAGLAVALAGAGCGDGPSAQGEDDPLATVRVDGDSALAPFVRAAIARFGAERPGVRFTLGDAGATDALADLCRGQVDVVAASRPADARERAACRRRGIRLAGVPVARDAIAVVADESVEVPGDCLTLGQLRRLLRPGAGVDDLAQLGDGFAAQRVQFLTPAEGTGTFAVFTARALGTPGAQRVDRVQTSPDEAQLAEGIAATPGALGYVALAHAEARRGGLQVLAVRTPGGACVEPTTDSVRSGEYRPLTRSLHLYVDARTARRPALAAFTRFVAARLEPIAEAADTVPLTESQRERTRRRVARLAG